MAITSGPSKKSDNLTTTTITVQVNKLYYQSNIYLILETIAAPGFGQNNQITFPDGSLKTIDGTILQSERLGRGANLVGKTINIDTIIGKRQARKISINYEIEAGDILIETAKVAGQNPTQKAEYFDTYIKFV